MREPPPEDPSPRDWYRMASRALPENIVTDCTADNYSVI